MKAEGKSFSFVLNIQALNIPFFQRNYVWDESNWGALLEEFLRVGNSQFIGSLILKNEDDDDTSIKRVSVIDGQQRLTTLSILLKALSDSFHFEKDRLIEGVFSDAYPYLFAKINSLDKVGQLRIQHSRVDREAYERVMRGAAEELLKATSASNVIRCYQYYYSRFIASDFSEEQKGSLLNRLTNSEDPFWVVISLGRKDQEQAIFDTINSAGVRLSYADTIKNSLFYIALQKARPVGREDEIIGLYDKTWFDSFEGDEDSRRFWQQEAQSVRMTRTTLEVFLHCYACIRNFYDPRKDSLSDLPGIYKQKVQGLGLDEIVAFLKDLSDVASVYREKLKDFGVPGALMYGDPVGRLFHILSECNVLTFHPYLLHLFFKYRDDEKTLLVRFSELERFVMRQYAAHVSTRQNNSYCVEFILDENAVAKRSAEIPNSEIEAHLRAIGNRPAKLILFWLELYRRHVDNDECQKDLHYTYQLEHVMPQKWEENWSCVPVVDDAGAPISNIEEAKKVRSGKIYEIGNMTLLTRSLNIKISNSALSVKIDGEGRKKGVRSYTELHIAKDDILIPYDKGDVVWDEAHIARRTKKLIGEFMALWG